MESWKGRAQQHLVGLAQALEEKEEKDSKALAEYLRTLSDDLNRENTLQFGTFQRFWYRHKRVAALRDVKKQISKPKKTARDDRSRKSRQTEDKFDDDDILSLTDPWDLESEKLEDFKDNVQRCLEEDRDFFKSDRVEDISSSDDDELEETENAFNSVARNVNGAYRVLKKQALALRLRSLSRQAQTYYKGTRVNLDKCVTTYVSEKRWANRSHTERKENREKLMRWRLHGEKWLSLEEPAIILAFSHIPGDNGCFSKFEQRRLSVKAINAVIKTLQAVAIIDDLRELWCRQLIRRRLGTGLHPEHCFCRRRPDSRSLEQPHISQKRPTEPETTSSSASVASKRRRLDYATIDEGELTTVSHGRTSSTGDNGSERASEESCPSSVPRENGDSTDIADEAAASSTERTSHALLPPFMNPGSLQSNCTVENDRNDTLPSSAPAGIQEAQFLVMGNSGGPMENFGALSSGHHASSTTINAHDPPVSSHSTETHFDYDFNHAYADYDYNNAFIDYDYNNAFVDYDLDIGNFDVFRYGSTHSATSA